MHHLSGAFRRAPVSTRLERGANDLSLLSETMLLIRTKTRSSTNPIKSRTRTNERHTAEAEGLQKEQGGGEDRDPPKPPRQGSTPEHEHPSSEREETAEDVRDAVHRVGQQVQGVGNTVVLLRTEYPRASRRARRRSRCR